MSTVAAATQSVIVEREFPHPPEKVWRAITDSNLIEQWLMKNDFQPNAGHNFKLSMQPVGGWDGVINCKVLEVDPPHSLSYTWTTLGQETVVTLSLTPTATGTHLRVEQAGFRPDQQQNIQGATWGWNSFLGRLATVLESA